MARLLDTLDRVKALNKLEALDDHMPANISRHLGVALLTVREQFEDIVWQTEVPKMSEDDRAAVMSRAPAKLRPIKPGPAKAGEKPEDPVDVDAVFSGSKDGVEMQVKITAHSPLGANLGETEGTVHIGADGKVSQFELDITAFQLALTGKGSVAEVTVTMSGNATIDMDKSGSRVAAMNAQIKAELAISLKRVKLLERRHREDRHHVRHGRVGDELRVGIPDSGNLTKAASRRRLASRHQAPAQLVE